MIVIQDDSTPGTTQTRISCLTTRSLARYHILYISISTLTTSYPRPHRGRPPASTDRAVRAALTRRRAHRPRRQQPTAKERAHIPTSTRHRPSEAEEGATASAMAMAAVAMAAVMAEAVLRPTAAMVKAAVGLAAAVAAAATDSGIWWVGRWRRREGHTIDNDVRNRYACMVKAFLIGRTRRR